MQSQSGESQEYQGLEAASQQLQKENLAQCRIWAHWLFWTICPFGPVISAFKCKIWKPLLIAMIIGACGGFLSAFAETDEDAEVISGIGLIASAIVGGAMTNKAISDARK
ncbi:hypothetical protein IQ241_23410 [Romeria aff. gracilis LEGE 07310]|uniref:Uncharacterized protein n=1 Tax=Vasconcelosia minhoensis LEGE 07310 TaxID=915328 RepID=A0A8J7AW87_9CYAN|nr:hypothetical protein [Romeria gracilis]MBE9080199.1 hypothetical protein [Romeria aff. gracilis LEGE 07310]